MSDENCDHNWVPAKIDGWMGWFCTRCAQRSTAHLSFADIFHFACMKDPQGVIRATQELIDASNPSAREYVEESLRRRMNEATRA
jgi:hypothetical protein